LKVKLLLREDVDNLGITGDVVEVAPGYARNCLLPKGLAKEINASTIQEIEKAKKRRESREADRKAGCAELAGQVNGTAITVAAKVSDTGTLYGAINKSAIVAALAEKGFAIESAAVKLPKIKELGEYTVSLRLHAEVEAECVLTVVEDESTEEISDEIPDELSDIAMGDKKIEEAMDREMEHKGRRRR
jgi:large subunit ribosomal protein L9